MYMYTDNTFVTLRSHVTKKCYEIFSCFVRLYIEYSKEPVDVVENLCTEVFPELLQEDSDTSITIPTLCL